MHLTPVGFSRAVVAELVKSFGRTAFCISLIFYLMKSKFESLDDFRYNVDEFSAFNVFSVRLL